MSFSHSGRCVVGPGPHSARVGGRGRESQITLLVWAGAGQRQSMPVAGAVKEVCLDGSLQSLQSSSIPNRGCREGGRWVVEVGEVAQPPAAIPVSAEG